MENQKGLFLHHLKTHFWVPVKQEMIFGPCQETSYTAITLNPESNFTRREKNHSLFPLKYIDVSRTTHTNLDVMQERRIDDYWNIDGSRDLSDSWTGFTQFTLLEEKTPDEYMWSGRRVTRRQVTSRPDYLWPELWTKLGRNAELREKQEWSIEDPKLDNARRLRGIISLTLRTRSSKKPLGMLERNWKHQWLPLCLARHARKVIMERPVARLMISGLNLRVSWNPVNPQDCVWKNLYPITMRTIMQEKGQFTTTLQFGTQIYSYASSNEDTRSKSSSG